jgi:hypothetical protein
LRWYLPSSAGLLTPMAADLDISEGTAGQVVTVTATVGAVAAFFANVVIGRLNRNLVLVGLSALAVIPNLVAAFATVLDAPSGARRARHCAKRLLVTLCRCRCETGRGASVWVRPRQFDGKRFSWRTTSGVIET